MHFRHRRTAKWIAAAGAAALAVVTVPLATSASSDAEQVAAMWIEGEPSQLSPLIGRSGQAFQVMTLIYDTVWRTSPEGELVGSLAADWSISDDASEYTINFHEGLTWSDGEPFTVDDVIFSYTIIANRAISNANPARFATVEGYSEYNDGTADTITGLEKVDDDTLIVRHSTPNASWIDEMIGASQFIVPAHVFTDVATEDLPTHSFFTDPSVFIGPFTLTEWVPGEYIELTRNESYRTDVGLEKLYIEWGDPNAAMARLEAGDIDLMLIGPADAARLEAAGLEVATVDGLGPLRWAAKWEDGPLSDVRVRQALYFAIDRQGMIDALLEGIGTTTDQPFINAMEEYLPDGLTEYTYDPDRARELLADAGWVEGTTIRLMFEAGGEVAGEQIAAVAQAQLGEVGIDVTLMPMEGGLMVEHIQNRDFDLVQYAGGRYSSPATLISTHTCVNVQPNGPNNAGYCNARVDELFDLGRAETDPAALAEIYGEMAQIFDQEIPYHWLVNYDVLWAANPAIENFEPHPDGGTLWQPHLWTVGG